MTSRLIIATSERANETLLKWAGMRQEGHPWPIPSYSASRWLPSISATSTTILPRSVSA